jgi:hypothetical protein
VAVIAGLAVVAAVVVCSVVVPAVVEGGGAQPVVDLPDPSSQTSVASAGRGVGVTGGLGRSQPAARRPTPRRARLTVLRRGLAPCNRKDSVPTIMYLLYPENFEHYRKLIVVKYTVTNKVRTDLLFSFKIYTRTRNAWIQPPV